LGTSLSSDAEAPLTNKRWPLRLYTFIFMKVGRLTSRRRGGSADEPKMVWRAAAAEIWEMMARFRSILKA